VGVGSRTSTCPRITVILAAGAAVAAAGIVTLTVAGCDQRPGTSATANADSVRHGGSAALQRTADPLKVLSASPADGSHAVNGTAAITLTFNQPFPAGMPFPRLTPAIDGSWQRSGSSVTFTPDTGFTASTTVQVEVPGAGTSGTRAGEGGAGRTPGRSEYKTTFITARYSTLRLQQLLAQLGYLPLSWAPYLGGTVTPGSAQAQLAAAYSAPTGSFSWYGGYPGTLYSFWKQGSPNTLDTGAITGFEADHGLQADGVASPAVWKALLAAAAAGQKNKHGYSYAIVDQSEPETLTIWHDGKIVLSSPANTGIAVSPTTVGTFAVYEKLPFQIMSGTNPDGSHYADPVEWVSYFDGGQAVHYFPRGSYGSRQSLGCVELPYGDAERSYSVLPYGTLVTVNP
jgi:lipoprotein-anchoring transpeptidase ErfK/SrfK